MDEVIFYRRRLPHFQPLRGTFFVTTRLAGSLPLHAIEELKDERAFFHRQINEAKDEETRSLFASRLQERYYGKFDEYVNRINVGPRWLAMDEIARIVADALHFRDGRVYDLFSYIIMPNHIHIVFSVQRNDISLDRILQSLKRHTAREGNKILNREGSFWHHESYDHVVRDGADLERILEYVLLNPVKARLCKSWKDWEWSYIKRGLEVFD